MKLVNENHIVVCFQVWHKLYIFLNLKILQKLRSFLARNLKNYCLPKPKFHTILELF